MFKTILQMLIIASCAFYPLQIKGSTLSESEAKDLASDFFKTASIERLANREAWELAYVADKSGKPSYYVFNASDKKGFVIISADDSSLSVMGYSTTSTWRQQSVPEAAQALLENGNIYQTPTSWGMLTRSSGLAQKILSTPTWSQEAPFNGMIPNRPLVGCVGTALAEILKYHKFPAKRPQSLVKDGEPTAYDWDNMRDDNYRNGYTAAEGDAVATLVADAATAIGTDFGMSSSSAFEVKVPSALISMFGYDAGVSYKKGSEMDKESWDALIINEIDENRPVLYCGQDVSVGHAFVCDGYEMHGPTAYFHINWGWGGAADGFYASDALNPTVSNSYAFNNLTTIVYNIKPASSSDEWSPIHITSDERQIGITIDTSDINPGSTYSVRAGALKNISNNNFSGTLAVALFNSDGSLKQLLSEGKNINIASLNILKYTDISFTVPSDATISDNDVVRLVTKETNSEKWLKVANDLMTTGEIRAKGNDVPYFNINIPASVDGVEITTPANQVIKGRDFSFKVVSLSPENVVTVKANGFILSSEPDNSYRLTNVVENQEISILVQNAADVVYKRNIWVQSGKLSQIISETESATIKDLTLYGTINAEDFSFIREKMKLSRLDLSSASITASGADPANAIPAKALKGCSSLTQIILPKNINTLKNGCFSYSGLTSVEIPASVTTIEYNIFLGCDALHEVIARRPSPTWINWCVFQGTPKAKLIVPVGASEAYRNKDYWKEFKEIIEENPVDPQSYSVMLQDSPGIRFIPISETTETAPGSQYQFKIETEDSYGDAIVEIYANNNRIYPDQDGVFKTVINANTLIHVDFRKPDSAGADSPWKITGAAGGVGLVTDLVNVVAGKSFTIRANALAIPSDNADTYYCAALTDKNGAIKELISPIVYNSIYNFGNLPANFTCQVKESTVREGNLVRIVTSVDKKKWNLVNADNDTINDHIDAIGNRVVYHNINMPEKVEGAAIEGGATRVVRGMPFSMKVTPVSVDDRITIAINGINTIVEAPIANISIPAVVEDMEIAIQVNPMGSDAYTMVNVKEGELDAKIAQCPSRLKIIGVMRSEDFNALRKHASTIVDLDLADVTIKGAGDLANAIPSSAFASTETTETALQTIILPSNLVNIEENAFYRCTALKEITIPATVTYVGAGAFSTCSALNKIIMNGAKPPVTGNMNPFPDNSSQITLEVPEGAEQYYQQASFWNSLGLSTSEPFYNIQIDPERSFNYNEYFTLTKIPKMNTTVNVGLPNSTKSTNPVRRPNVAFRVYDNDYEVTYYTYGGSSYSSVRYGQHGVIFDPSYSETSRRYPQDHVIKVVFHYPINFKLPSNISAEFVDVNEENVWKEVWMELFVEDSEQRPTLYKEGEDYKFRLNSESDNLDINVKSVSKIMTKVGNSPEYKTVETNLIPDENGLYVISNLQGDTQIEITASPRISDGSLLSAEEISLVSNEAAKTISDISITGTLDETAFSEIREKFVSLESINMSGLENDIIPANALSGMTQLRDIVIPGNVKTIGDNAFAGCSNLGTITLPGVSSIGDGAFDGCSSLTSITILGVSSDNDKTDTSTRSSANARIAADSFIGINPNCLIYLPENWSEDLSGIKNVIINKSGARVATGDIELSGNYPFEAPASFSLADHSISLSIDIPGSTKTVGGGWKGIILPFTPDEIVYGEDFTPRGEKVLNIMSFSGESDSSLSPAENIVANTPYFANMHAPFESMSVTFSAKGKSTGDQLEYDITTSPQPEELKATGSGFTLYGSFNGKSVQSSPYLINDDGSALSKAVESSSAVAPFSVYACADDVSSPAVLNIGNHPLWVFDPKSSRESGSKLYRSELIDLTSQTKGASIYFTTDGTDPTDSDTRQIYASPISIADESVLLHAVAECEGNFSDPVELEYGLKKTNVARNLEEGWNWISHNVENDIPVASVISDNVSRILSQSEEAIRDPQSGFVGNLENLHPLEAYKVMTSGEDTQISISGISFDPATKVKLHKGWNWIGCHSENDAFPITDMFANLEIEEGDMIVGREGFSQVDAEGNWVGNLSQLLLGHGYMYLSGSNKEFTYNTLSSDNATQATSDETEQVWKINRGAYPSVMPVTSCLATEDGIPASEGEYVIGAFCGDECRGIGVPVDRLTMIGVFGNPGDLISFRVISNKTGDEYILNRTITFSEDPAGSLKEPLALTIDSSSVGNVYGGEYNVSVENGSLVISGDTSAIDRVEIYDMCGMKEHSLSAPNGSSISVDGLPSGIHVILIYSGTHRTSRKIEIK